MQVTITIPEHAITEVKAILELRGVEPTDQEIARFFHADVMAVYFTSLEDTPAFTDSVRQFWNV